MASRNTQSSAGRKSENMKGPVCNNMRSFMRENFAYNRNNKTKQGLSQDRECFRLND